MRKYSPLLCVVITAALFLATVPTAALPGSGNSPQGAPPLHVYNNLAQRQERPLYAAGELIVRFKADVSAYGHAQLLAEQGITAVNGLLVPGYALVTFPSEQDVGHMAASLASLSAVEWAEPNYYRYADFTPNDPLYSYQWHFPKIQMPAAWDLSQGAGVTVAVVDTGVAYENYGSYAQAPDLAGTAFVPGWDFVNNDAHPNDDNAHGTHVAGTIAQTTNNSLGVAGVAFRARIMPVKVLDKEGSGTDAQVANGIVWAADHGAQVINLSLGGSTSSSVLQNAVNYAYNKGVTLIAATGNDGLASVDYPAAYSTVIAVGAVRFDETLAYYSNYGTALDIVAPGGDVTVDQNGDGYKDGVLQQTFNPTTQNPTDFDYWYFQGTSMATPHVAGVAALLIAAGKAATPDQVWTAIRSTAKDLGSAGWDSRYGYGLVQAYSALTGTGPVPTATRTPGGPTATRTPWWGPTATRTPWWGPTATRTPGGPTATRTPSGATATRTPWWGPTATRTPGGATATRTPGGPTATPTPWWWPTATRTPGGPR